MQSNDRRAGRPAEDDESWRLAIGSLPPIRHDPLTLPWVRHAGLTPLEPPTYANPAKRSEGIILGPEVDLPPINLRRTQSTDWPRTYEQPMGGTLEPSSQQYYSWTDRTAGRDYDYSRAPAHLDRYDVDEAMNRKEESYSPAFSDGPPQTPGPATYGFRERGYTITFSRSSDCLIGHQQEAEPPAAYPYGNREHFPGQLIPQGAHEVQRQDAIMTEMPDNDTSRRNSEPTHTGIDNMRSSFTSVSPFRAPAASRATDAAPTVPTSSSPNSTQFFRKEYQRQEPPQSRKQAHTTRSQSMTKTASEQGGPTSRAPPPALPQARQASPSRTLHSDKHAPQTFEINKSTATANQALTQLPHRRLVPKSDSPRTAGAPSHSGDLQSPVEEIQPGRHSVHTSVLVNCAIALQKFCAYPWVTPCGPLQANISRLYCEELSAYAADMLRINSRFTKRTLAEWVRINGDSEGYAYLSILTRYIIEALEESNSEEQDNYRLARLRDSFYNNLDNGKVSRWLNKVETELEQIAEEQASQSPENRARQNRHDRRHMAAGFRLRHEAEGHFTGPGLA